MTGYVAQGLHEFLAHPHGQIRGTQRSRIKSVLQSMPRVTLDPARTYEGSRPSQHLEFPLRTVPKDVDV